MDERNFENTYEEIIYRLRKLDLVIKKIKDKSKNGKEYSITLRH